MFKQVINRYILIIIGTICIWTSANINWGKDHWKSILEADAKGYYAYLPATFIYHDLNFSFFDTIEKYYFKENLQYDYRINNNGVFYDKYFAGTAVCQLPFFLIAHAITKIIDEQADGYSRLYPIMINIAGIFYLLIGLYFLKKLLQLYQINKSIITASTIALTFGTNLFYYSFSEPGLSHIYSFATINVFFFILKKQTIAYKKSSLPIMAILLGLICLIRPINLMVLGFAPFIVGSANDLKKIFNHIFSDIPHLTIAICVGISIIAIQPFIYYVQTGNWWVEVYPGENFNWLNPHLLQILFSFKKGLFIYAPILLLIVLGFANLLKSNRFQFITVLFALLIVTYVLSSWHNWWYGGSFGSRVFVDFYSIFALLISIGLQALISKTYRSIIYAFIVLCVMLCQFQTYQYRYYLIHWENMNWNKYWDVFLRLPRS